MTASRPRRHVAGNPFKGLSRRDDLVYDRQDMFYLPLPGLQVVTLAGHNFAASVRRVVAVDVAPAVAR